MIVLKKVKVVKTQLSQIEAKMLVKGSPFKKDKDQLTQKVYMLSEKQIKL